MFKTDPPASYSFAASEGLRRFGFEADRATVRRWAGLHGLSISKPRKPKPAFIRRWQCQQIGALWQLDVSPHAWFGPHAGNLPLFDLIDDCSRVMTGTRLYPRESLLAYLDFLSRAFEEYGLPLALYVDYHSFFFSYLPDALTTLGEALRFHDISFKYAPTPQAKGKVERAHQFWQNRLPSYFAAESIHQIPDANTHLQQLRIHHNSFALVALHLEPAHQNQGGFGWHCAGRHSASQNKLFARNSTHPLRTPRRFLHLSRQCSGQRRQTPCRAPLRKLPLQFKRRGFSIPSMTG